MEEVWKPVKGFEGIYEVSNLGRVKSLSNNFARKEKILKPSITVYGYGQYVLNSAPKIELWKAHRLIAEHFISKIPGKDCINHKDGDKLNNCVDNLEWCTRRDNIIHSYNVLNREHTKMKDNFIFPPKSKSVTCFDDNGVILGKYKSLSFAAKTHNINRSMICNSIKSGYKCKGIYWRYSEI